MLTFKAKNVPDDADTLLTALREAEALVFLLRKLIGERGLKKHPVTDDTPVRFKINSTFRGELRSIRGGRDDLI